MSSFELMLKFTLSGALVLAVLVIVVKMFIDEFTSEGVQTVALYMTILTLVFTFTSAMSAIWRY